MAIRLLEVQENEHYCRPRAFPEKKVFLKNKKKYVLSQTRRMPMKWKPDKAGGVRKRERNARLKKIQLRKDFAKNMEGAEALAEDFYTGTKCALLTVISDVCDLEQKYVDWARNKFRYLKFNEPMTQEHKDMEETWREIVTSTAACAKATEARIAARDLQKRRPLLYNALKQQKRLQREKR
jgi:hypothetical protein